MAFPAPFRSTTDETRERVFALGPMAARAFAEPLLTVVVVAFAVLGCVGAALVAEIDD